jgi:hypothetical protein
MRPLPLKSIPSHRAIASPGYGTADGSLWPISNQSGMLNAWFSRGEQPLTIPDAPFDDLDLDPGAD